MFETPASQPAAPLLLVDRGEVAAAGDLLASYGDTAAIEAARRARHSRDLGNHIHYCRWRQVERLIGFLAVRRASGTIH